MSGGGINTDLPDYMRDIFEEKMRWLKDESLRKARCGLEPIPRDMIWSLPTCRNPEHQPPGMVCVPNGMRYRHVCPGCERVSYIYGQEVTL